jgi:hypothetical protein
MNGSHTPALLRHVQFLFLVGAAVLLAIVTLVYFWVGNQDFPAHSQLRLFQSFVMSVATDMVPVFLIFVGSYAFLRKTQQIQAEHDREALTLAIADAVRADLSESIRDSGVHDVFRRFYREVPWGDLFHNARDFDLVANYARTWKNMNRDMLRELANHPKATIRIVLANPDNPDLMCELARRYDLSVVEVTACVRESLSDFAALLAGRAADCRIHVSDRAASYTCYRFDDAFVFTLFSNNNAKADRPGFLLKRDGTLTRFLREEFEEYFRASRAYQPLNQSQATGVV